ncbi:MAG: DUF11 domain-containing protein, partial [Ardenticatenales bacterium]|nr:DUF11 domain-containing protein [Ardenticatenales bacterium]
DAIWKAWQYHLKLVVRVGRAPAWARINPDPTAPPADPDDLRNFMQALAASSVTQIAGYIIWNEPNLAAEWGGDPPNAAAYTALLQAAYNGVQTADPDALVISAGLAPTNGDPPTAVDDRTFLQDMYTAGAGSYFDMLGVNPLGFASAPDDTTDPNHYHFARALEWRAIMVANGDAGKQMFAAEMGWLRDTQNDLGGHNWMKVSEIDQAHYLARAYHKARCEMPWMGPMSTWNLDFAGFYADPEHLHWYAVTDQNRDPLRAYLTLQNAATHGPADLWVELEQIDPIVHGQNFRYRLRYTNVGGQTAAGVTLTDTLPAGTEYVSDTGGGHANGDQIVWDLGDVDLCAYQTITLTARLSGSGWPGGPLINTLEASTVPGEPYADDNLVQVTNPVVAELAIQKSVNPTATRPGQTVSYTLTYRNSGQISATGVRITDVLPITLTTISHSSAGALITPTGSVSYTWQVAELAPGQGGVITITGIVSPAVSGVSSFPNEATITTGAVEASLDNNTSTVSLTVDDEPPDPPTLQGPADNSRINDNTPTLTWTASPSSDAAGYLLGLDWGVLDMGDALQYTTAVLPDGPHAWTVAAYDLAGNTGMITDTWSFTVDTEPPDPPTLQSPADNLRTGDNTPTLIWSASPSPDAAGYLLDLAGMLVDVGNTTRYTSSVLMDGTYTWTVAAYDGAGNIGTYAAVWSFTAEPYYAHLPLVARNYVVAPELVVDRTVATSNEVQVGIKNVGNAAVMDDF